MCKGAEMKVSGDDAVKGGNVYFFKVYNKYFLE